VRPVLLQDLHERDVELVQKRALVPRHALALVGRRARDDHVGDEVADAGALLVRQGPPPPLDDVLEDLEGKELRLRVSGVLEDGVDAGPGVRVGLDGLEHGLGGGALVGGGGGGFSLLLLLR